MPTLIHINDNNLLVQKDDVISRSQGYAWLNQQEVNFDFEEHNIAIANCRLDPQQINSRYWQQCEQSAISSNKSGMRHSADLIWQHLSALRKVHRLDEVVLVVPSHYQAVNLQLLLGIAKSVGLQVNGIVNKAVHALHQKTQGDGLYLHVDVQLHQTVCSEVAVANGKIKLGQIETLHDVGIQNMQDSLLKEIQNRFIANDRFDPLHHAETEQQLFDQLPALANELVNSGKANISVAFQKRQHVSSIDAKQWAKTLSHYFEKLNLIEVDSKPDYRCFDFNGFECPIALSKNDFLITKLPLVSNIIEEIYSNEDKEKENLIYHTELQFDVNNEKTLASKNIDKDQESEKVANSADDLQNNSEFNNLATHLLHAGFAIPIKQVRITTKNNQLGIELDKKSNLQKMLEENKLFVMGDLQRKIINVNDRLGSNLADGVITVIQTLGAPR